MAATAGEEGPVTVRMAVYYRPPEDPAAFEKRYVDGHLPLIGKYEKIESYSFNKVTRVIAGDFPYAYAFVGTWADRDGWKADLGSEAAKVATQDAQEMGVLFDVVVFEQLA